jgi:hypothetical protein
VCAQPIPRPDGWGGGGRLVGTVVARQQARATIRSRTSPGGRFVRAHRGPSRPGGLSLREGWFIARQLAVHLRAAKNGLIPFEDRVDVCLSSRKGRCRGLFADKS